MKRSIHLLTAALLLVALTAACGSKSKTNNAATDSTTTTAASTTGTTGAGSKGTGENSHACDLVTVADIQLALGATVGAGTRSEPSDVTTCTFQSADHNTNVHVFRYERGGDLPTNIRAADKNAKTCTGIGDDCVEEVALGKITFTIGEIGVSIESDSSPTAAQLEQIGKLAYDHFNNP
jgi:hypothetical protein